MSIILKLLVTLATTALAAQIAATETVHYKAAKMNARKASKFSKQQQQKNLILWHFQAKAHEGRREVPRQDDGLGQRIVIKGKVHPEKL